MVNLTSEELQQAQKTLETLVKLEVDFAMSNYSKVNNLLKVIKDVDKLRREVWNNEKFGASEMIADETMKVLNINSDDIPF